MSLVEDHLNSIDARLAEARAAWEAEKKGLLDIIQAREVELALTKTALDAAIKARSTAEMTSAKLVAQFGMVSQVFEEAKELAIEAGLYTKETAKAEDSAGVAAAKVAIDEATNGK